MTPPRRTSALVTGAFGAVGRGVVPLLRHDFDLRLLTLEPRDDPRAVQADLLDWDGLARALAGVDAVLHLAIAPGHTGTYEDDRFNDARFDVNVKGTFHVFETARRLGVRRVVNVSSAMVTWGHARQAPPGPKVPGDAPPKPVGTYALTKALAEQVARHYADEHNMEVITVRIAAPLDVDHARATGSPVRPQQAPFADLAQAFRLALTAPLPGYATVTITGDSKLSPWSLEEARRVLGHSPELCLDDLGLAFIDPFAVERK